MNQKLYKDPKYCEVCEDYFWNKKDCNSIEVFGYCKTCAKVSLKDKTKDL